MRCSDCGKKGSNSCINCDGYDQFELKTNNGGRK
jgi:hypothetical protein